MHIPSKEALEKIYGRETEEATKRYTHLDECFQKEYGCEPEDYFSAPGRTEIIGNHVDHNGGKILAAAITMDTICAAAPTGDDNVTIISEGYRPICLKLSEVEQTAHCNGATSLVAGILAGTKKHGYSAGGFRAYVTSKVIPSAGVSSSASFEMLICSVINHFFNKSEMDYAHYAKIGQYAENVYWEKASGLMDQMACAVGGTILLDFKEDVKYEKVEFSYGALGSELVIINTGKGHSNLSEEYSSIPREMRLVAKELCKENKTGATNSSGQESEEKKPNLCDASEEKLLRELPKIRESISCDRALLRALHYYEEVARVEEAVTALHAGKQERVLQLISEAGNSSWKWLQNAAVTGDKKDQSIPLALALTEIFCKQHDAGVCRIHGGGFAGVISAVIKDKMTKDYVDFMAPYFGKNNIYVMNIREAGAVCV